MKLKYLSKILLSTLIASPAIMTWSCRDDLNLSREEAVIEGLPANIHISLTIKDMDIRTRNAGKLPEEANEVKNLWVGIFDADNNNNGVKINDLVILSSEKVGEHVQNGKINIDLTAYSGKVYIVAVANAQDKKYYLPVDENATAQELKKTTHKDLLDLLQDEHLTWYDYQAIATALSNPTNLTRQGTESFIMSGYYKEGTIEVTHPDGITPQTISPGENEGVIHLRRLDAYNLFRIHVNKNIKFTPISWQVVNIPALSFVQERAGANDVAVNASDLYMGEVKFEGYSPYEVAGNASNGGSKSTTYHNSEVYEAQWFDKGTSDREEKEEENNKYKDMWTFDFYIRENKHTGILEDPNKTYNYREWEFKVKDGVVVDNGEHENASVSNTGWYRSLVSSPGAAGKTTSKWDPNNNLWNNNATYIVLHAKMEYYYNKNGDDKLPVDEETTDKSNLISRTADVTYTIHLGYCKGKDEQGNPTDAEANDFNCRRNTSYTYNVLINGVDNITVEAGSNLLDGENFQHGMEGMVTDQFEAKTIHLDSHYGVFNIQLTDAERRTMEWAIETPFGDKTYRFYYNKDSKKVTLNNTKEIPINQLTQNQFYNWIQIRPTTGENILAHYPGDPRLKDTEYDKGDIEDWAQNGNAGGMWSLAQLADPENYPHPESSEENKDGEDIKRNYTVFIDEYVYEKGELNLSNMTFEDAAVASNWYNFVNIADRKFWLYYEHGPHISADGKNIYNEANFEMTQESIQSYYSSERVRLKQEELEQEGKTMGIFGVESLNESYRKNRNYATEKAEINWTPNSSDGLYNTYHYSQQLEGWKNVFTGFESSEEKETLRKGNEDNEEGIAKTFYIPEHDDYFMNACLARNRDLNNNGKIDVNEIRWYLPTDQTYTRIILGTASLRSPLFDAKSMPQNSITPGAGKPYSHYAASNKRQTWAEELAATGELGSAGNLRCIRNLGLRTDVTPIQNPGQASEYKIPTPAFIHDRVEHTIEMYYFRSAALRSYTSSALNPHSIIDKNAYASRKFQYAKDYCRPGVNLVAGYSNSSNASLALLNGYNEVAISNFRDVYENGKHIDVNRLKWSESLRENSICKFYHENPNLSDVGQWRVPNITELGLIFLNDVLNNFGLNYTYISSSYEYFLLDDTTRGNYYMGVDQARTDITAFLGAARVICVKDIETSY